MHKFRRLLGLLSVAVCAIAGTACSSASKGATTSSTAPSTSQPTEPTTTTSVTRCVPDSAYGSGTATHTLTVGGTPREFLVHLPPSPTTTMPLVVDFHGAGSNMVQQAIYSGFDATADTQGFIIATPNGIDAAVRQWRFIGTDDDVDFARAIVRELVDHACVDPDRVIATGISSGAAMSARLACSASDVFTGFALIAADFYLGALCGNATPRPMLMFHGTDDRIVPYDGGAVNGPGTGGRTGTRAAETIAADWAAHHRCDPTPNDDAFSEHVTRRTWMGCREPVTFYRITGGGHTWPGAAIAVARLGPTTDEVSATKLVADLLLAEAER